LIEQSSKISTYLNDLFGQSIANKYLEFAGTDHATYVRANPLKTTRDKITSSLLRDYNISSTNVPNLPNAFKINSGFDVIGKTIEHIIGEYYIQSLSSMIPPIVLDPSPDDTILDLCSAPGSKTTEIGEMMNNSGVLIANEIQLDRVKMLVYNIERMNLVNAGVTHFKGELLSKIFDNHFDKILVDAPCSGLGIIQKKGEINNWWSKEKAEQLSDLQLKLLIAAVKMVKTGGEIVYSTCTMTVEENEMVIDKLLNKYPVEIVDITLPVKSIEGLTSYEGKNLNPALSKARRILPWEIDSEGFFIVKLRKTDDTQPNEKMNINVKDLSLISFDNKKIKNELIQIAAAFGIEEEVLRKYKYIFKGRDLFFVNSDWDGDYLSVFERIGTKFGSIEKHDAINLHTQAAQILRNDIKKNIFTIQNSDQLKKYLEGGIIKEEFDYRGQTVVKYKDYILGTAVVTDGGLKSRFPRAKRTQEILYPE
jgi:16S rRNA (cytosine1407-C5)-methyltransferase